MKKGIALFFIGLVMFMLGIYLSIKWIIVGTLIGISGGVLVGVSSYLLVMQSQTKMFPNKTLVKKPSFMVFL